MTQTREVWISNFSPIIVDIDMHDSKIIEALPSLDMKEIPNNSLMKSNNNLNEVFVTIINKIASTIVPVTNKGTCWHFQ